MSEANIGHNKPPVTPFDESREEITGLYEEAKLWLDGEPVETQEMADKIGLLLDKIRKASKVADDRRKEEVKPFDAGKKEVQARYNELIGDTKTVTGIAVKATKACKEALAPYLAEQDRKQREAEEAARKEAEAKRKEAEEAIRASSVANLQEREEAEAKLKEAEKAEKVLSVASKQKAQAKVAGGRAISLRTIYRPEIIDLREVARYYWQEKPEEMQRIFTQMVEVDVRSGARNIPGVTVHEDKVAQ